MSEEPGKNPLGNSHCGKFHIFHTIHAAFLQTQFLLSFSFNGISKCVHISMATERCTNIKTQWKTLANSLVSCPTRWSFQWLLQWPMHWLFVMIFQHPENREIYQSDVLPTPGKSGSSWWISCNDVRWMKFLAPKLLLEDQWPMITIPSHPIPSRPVPSRPLFLILFYYRTRVRSLFTLVTNSLTH